MDFVYLLMCKSTVASPVHVYTGSVYLRSAVCALCVHTVPVTVTVEQFLIPPLPTVSQLLSCCLLPSSVSVMSCCHICPHDVSFILIAASRRLSKAPFPPIAMISAASLPTYILLEKVAFQLDT